MGHPVQAKAYTIVMHSFTWLLSLLPSLPVLHLLLQLAVLGAHARYSKRRSRLPESPARDALMAMNNCFLRSPSDFDQCVAREEAASTWRQGHGSKKWPALPSQSNQHDRSREIIERTSTITCNVAS